jgi:hypothetical protein
MTRIGRILTDTELVTSVKPASFDVHSLSPRGKVARDLRQNR